LELTNLKAGDHLLQSLWRCWSIYLVRVAEIGPGGRVDLIESSIPATESAKEISKNTKT
jgi:hypothetical protein